MSDNPAFDNPEAAANNQHKVMWAPIAAAGAITEGDTTVGALLAAHAAHLPEGAAVAAISHALDLLPAGGDGTPDVAATGATAGTPGSFTPANSYIPQVFADLAAFPIVANPLTAWTTNQRVVLGDASLAHWNGTAWAVGAA